jgi:hypothetical protein
MECHDVTLIEKERKREFHFGNTCSLLITRKLVRELNFELAARSQGCVKVIRRLARWSESV